MAFQTQLDCPHNECLTERAGFTGLHYAVIRTGEPDYIVFMQCGVCGNGVIARYFGVNFPHWFSNQYNKPAELMEIWPKRDPIEAPQYLPSNVTSYYLQGLDSLKRKNFDAAGTMFRKTLDTGLKHIDHEGKGTLEKRIDNLPAATGITPAMKEWAHHIRRLGNDAAHENDPFEDQEARDLHSFTELFLTYAFTLPGMLAERYPPAAPDAA
jgi:Domain of unknown function (DUF4145)